MAKDIEPGISGDIVGPVLRALAALGFDASRVPVDAAVVSGTHADAVIDAAAKALRDPAIGLTLAQRLPIGSLGILDYSLCTSSCLREALGRVSKYYGVVTQRVSLTLGEEAVGSGPDKEVRASLVFERTSGPRHSRHWAEFASAMIATRIRQTLGRPVAFSLVSFAHSPPPQVRVHDAFFGVPVQWSAKADAMQLDAKLLPLPLVTAASSLAEVLEAKMRELTPTSSAPDPLLSRVEVAVAQLLDSRVTSLAALATRLRMTRRTLQRELHARGTTHTQVLDTVRRERALRLLTEGKLSVTEVSYSLGLSEPSAFFRAFRRWTGTSPHAFRSERITSNTPRP